MRLALRARVHWLRLLLAHAILTFGGGSLVAALLGRAAPWASAGAGAGAFPALLIAHALFFHARGDWPVRGYRWRPLRDVWQFFVSAQLAFGVAAGAEAAAGLPLPTRALLAVLAANGGALLAEAGDVLLQGHTRYAAPMAGPGPGAVLAVGGAALYVGVLRGGAAAALFGAADAVPPATARAATLLAVAAANYFVPGRALATGLSGLLEAALPGFRAVWEPAAVLVGDARRAAERAELDAPAPWPLDAGLFGYHVTTLNELEARARGGALGAAAAAASAEAAAEAAAVAPAPRARGASKDAPPRAASPAARSPRPQETGSGSRAARARR